MRNFFQSRARHHQEPRPVQAGRPHQPQAAEMFHAPIRAELDDGVTVSELSELEARALCTREGIPFFWRESGAAAAR